MKSLLVLSALLSSIAFADKPAKPAKPANTPGYPEIGYLHTPTTETNYKVHWYILSSKTGTYWKLYDGATELYNGNDFDPKDPKGEKIKDKHGNNKAQYGHYTIQNLSVGTHVFKVSLCNPHGCTDSTTRTIEKVEAPTPTPTATP